MDTIDSLTCRVCLDMQLAGALLVPAQADTGPMTVAGALDLLRSSRTPSSASALAPASQLLSRRLVTLSGGAAGAAAAAAAAAAASASTAPHPLVTLPGRSASLYPSCARQHQGFVPSALAAAPAAARLLSRALAPDPGSPPLTPTTNRLAPTTGAGPGSGSPGARLSSPTANWRVMSGRGWSKLPGWQKGQIVLGVKRLVEKRSSLHLKGVSGGGGREGG